MGYLSIAVSAGHVVSGVTEIDHKLHGNGSESLIFFHICGVQYISCRMRDSPGSNPLCCRFSSLGCLFVVKRPVSYGCSL